MAYRETRPKTALLPTDSAVGDDDEATAEERGEKGWGSALLRRGWWLGKRVAIAGAAVTSGPVLIPPLLVFSALGVALSFPFAVYLASFAGSKKVMGSLLPLPSPPSPSEQYNLVVEEEDELEGIEETQTPGVYHDEGMGTETAAEGRIGSDDGLVEEAEATEKTVTTPDPFSKKIPEDVHPPVDAGDAERRIEIEHLGPEDVRKEEDLVELEPSVALQDKSGDEPGSDLGEGHAGVETLVVEGMGGGDRAEEEEVSKEAQYMDRTAVTPDPWSKEMAQDVHPYVATAPADLRVEQMGEIDKGGTGPSSDFEEGKMNRAGDDDQVESGEAPAKPMGIQDKAGAEEAGKKIVTPDPWSEDVHPLVAKAPSESTIETEHLGSEDATKERDVSESEPYEALEEKDGIGKSSDLEVARAKVEEEEAPGKEMAREGEAEAEAGEMGKEEAEDMEKTVMPHPLNKETAGCVHLHVAAVAGECKIEVVHLDLEDQREERDVVESEQIVALGDEGGIGSRLEFGIEDVNGVGAEAVGEEKPERGLGIGGNGETEYIGEKVENVKQVIKIEHLYLEEYRDEGFTDKLKEEKLPTSVSPLPNVEIGVSSEAHGGDRCERGVGTVEDDESNYRVAIGEKTEAEEMEKQQPSLRPEHASRSRDDRNAVFLEKEVKVVEGVAREDKEEMKGEDGANRRLEIKMSEAEQSGNERGSESKVEQNRRAGGSDIAQEERLVKEQIEVEDERKEEREGEDDPSEFSSEYASAAEGRSSDIADTESRGSMEQGLDTRLVTPTAIQGAMRSDEEGQLLEDRMWEQIHAIRTIIGYKAVLHSSLIGELRAMYLFTGVEPPVSFEETADIAEVSDKLQFLKSVIGVK